MEEKTQRINIRATVHQERIIRHAAEATDRSVPDFVVHAASVEAERIMADRRMFHLGPEQWTEFERLLEVPVPGSSKLSCHAARLSPFNE